MPCGTDRGGLVGKLATARAGGGRGRRVRPEVGLDGRRGRPVELTIFDNSQIHKQTASRRGGARRLAGPWRPVAAAGAAVPPNRLEAAKAGVRSLLDQSRGDRVGLIAFAGKPVLRAPLTTDGGFVREVLGDIDTQSAPRGGTRIGDAILLGLETMPPEGKRDQAIVLITDGEDHGSRLEAAIRQAADRNVRISTVAFGDPRTGARVPQADESGRRGYLRYEGQEVWSKADEGLLRRIAAQTGGGFAAAGSGGYQRGPAWGEFLGSLQREEIHQQRRVRYPEQFQWFLGAGILILLAEGAVARYPRQSKATGREDRP